MLTVKWISHAGAHSVYETDKMVVYWPFSVDRDEKAKVTFEYGDQTCTIDSGEVYVMNGLGATVAKYVLSTNAFPTGIEPRHAA